MNKKAFLDRSISFKSIIIRTFFIIGPLLLLSCFFYDTKVESKIIVQLLDEARAAVESENFALALDNYNLLLFFDNRSKDGILDFIKLYERFREYDKAIGLILDYKKAVPKDAAFDSILGELYYRAGNYSSALTYLGTGKIATMKKSICFERCGDLTKAESLYTALAPSFNIISDFLITRIVYCQLAKGVPESAVDLFVKLSKLLKEKNKKYIVAKDLLAHLVNEENYDEAIRFITLMKSDFRDKKTTLELEKAHIFSISGKEDEAFEIYQKLFANGREGAYTAGLKLLNASKLPGQEYLKLAQLCYSRKDYRNTRNLLSEYTKQTKSNYALYLLGMSYYRLGQNKNAVEIFKRLKDSYAEKRQIIVYYLGRAEEKIGNYESAMENYNDVGKNKKNKLADNALCLSALLQEDKGNFKKALAIYCQIKDEFEKGDYLIKAMRRGGILSFRMAQLPLSEEFFNKALTLSKKGRSNYASSIYWLGRIEEKRGNKEKRDSLWNIIKRDIPLAYFSFHLGGNKIDTEEKDTKKWLSTWTDTLLTLTGEEKIYWERGKTFLDIGFGAEAERSFSHIKQTTFLVYKLARLFKEKGFDYQSILYAVKVKARSPGNNFSKAPEELLKIEYPLLYLPTILEKSRKYGLQPEILAALIHQESAYRRNAISSANAIGLTQLLPAVAEEVARNNRIEYNGVEDLKRSPELSIELGAAHFSHLQKKFKKFEFSLAAYNAGERKAKEWKRKWEEDITTYVDMISYSETRGYVKRVLAKKEIYTLLWGLDTYPQKEIQNLERI